MTSRDTSAGPHSTDMNAFPNQQFDHTDTGDAASILSSRMTDIASDDGGEHIADSTTRSSAQQPGYRRGSAQTGESRPNTAVTGISSQRGQWSQPPPSRRGYASPHAQRGSVSGSTTGGRPQSATSRTHVPSLQSHAFFRPMSSQRLQQQRGGSRPPTMAQVGSNEYGSTEGGSSVARQDSVNSNQTAKQGQSTHDHGESPPPPSRGTEMTEHETAERVTANTSPTHGHNAAGSLTESVRPLQRGAVNTKGLTVNTDKSYKNGGNLPTPSKSPRSFRSSFLLPNRGDVASTSPNRSTQGREKLSSAASSPGLTPTDAPKPITKQKLGTNYEYFTGNTVFFWGGRLQNTRDKPISIATGLAVVLPGVLFLVFSAPWLWHNISPAIPLVFAYVFYICLSSFIHASLSDPGILPRNLHPMPPVPENEDPLTLGPPTNDWTLIKSATSSAAAMEVPTKYCKTCNIWRPPRGHHCRVCDNCIETQDHHCVWINNCVGRRNYRYFFVFLTTSTFLGLYILAASLAQIIVYGHQRHITFAQSIDHWRVPFAMVLYSILAIPYPAALMFYHLFLMARGDTTREYLNSHKFLKKDRHRPFTQGNWFKNWLVVLARPRPPTYLNFKRKYEEGDQRFGERKGKRTAPIKDEFKGQGVEGGMEMQSRGFQGPSALRNTPRP